MNVSETTFPVGTRVISVVGDLGTVIGWTRSRGSVTVEWDNGGTSSAPASHGLTLAPEPESEYVCKSCGKTIRDDVTDHALVTHRR